MASSHGTGESPIRGDPVDDEQQINPNLDSNASLIAECKSLYQELEKINTVGEVKTKLAAIKTTGQIKAIVGFSLLNSGALPIRSEFILRAAQQNDSPVEQLESNRRKTTWLESELAKRFGNNVARNKSARKWQAEWDQYIALCPKLKKRVTTRKVDPSSSNRAHHYYIRQTITCSACNSKGAISIQRSKQPEDASFLAKIVLNSLQVWNSQGRRNEYECGLQLEVPAEVGDEDRPYLLKRGCGDKSTSSTADILSSLDRTSCARCDGRLEAAESVQYEINGMTFPMCNTCLEDLPHAPIR